MVSALSGLLTLTFALSTSKFGHGLVTHVMGFLPAIFQLPMYALTDLGSGTGQTDDGHQLFRLHPV